MKKVFLILSIFLCCAHVSAQSYDAEKVNMINFILRVYKSSPFDVKLINTYDHDFLVSCVILDPAKYNGNESTIQRVASVKAMSQASRYLNGSQISDELVIVNTETDSGQVSTETIEKLKENSVGYVKALEQFSNFSTDDGKRVFIYGKQIE